MEVDILRALEGMLDGFGERKVEINSQTNLDATIPCRQQRIDAFRSVISSCVYEPLIA
jgi:hypothetical protein